MSRVCVFLLMLQVNFVIRADREGKQDIPNIILKSDELICAVLHVFSR